MAAFIPGESPPEVKTPIFFIVFDIFQLFNRKISKREAVFYRYHRDVIIWSKIQSFSLISFEKKIKFKGILY
jgi:hypothetical protein